MMADMRTRMMAVKDILFEYHSAYLLCLFFVFLSTRSMVLTVTGYHERERKL